MMRVAYINAFGPPEVIQIGELNQPRREKETDVLIQVHFASVNPVDTKTRQGNHKFILGKKFPRVLGYDVSGIVVECRNNGAFRPGDRVCARVDNRHGGCYAEYVLCAEAVISKVPDLVSLKTAAAIPLAGCTALQALRDKGGIQPDSRVLIHGGSGGVGHLAVQISTILGAETEVVSSTKNHEFLRSLGADFCYDYQDSDWKKKLGTYDLIFDVAGNLTFTEFLHKLNKKGSFVEILPRPKILLWKLISLFSSRKVSTLLIQSNADDLDLLLQWVKDGQLVVDVEHEYSLEEVVKAHKQMESGHTRGKIVLKIHS